MNRKSMGIRAGSTLGLMIVGVVLMTGTAVSKESLAARLQKVEDRLAIEQLLMGDYPKALDSANWKDYAALFTSDGELVAGKSVMKGPAAIEENFSKPRAPRPRPATDAAGGSATPAAPATPPTRPITKHIVTDLNLKIDGDTATDTAYWQTVSLRDGKTTIAGAGHYVDVLKKVNGVWKFQHREIAGEAAPAAPATPPATPTP